MEITIIRNESEILNEYFHNARPVDGNTGTNSKKQKGNGRRGGIIRGKITSPKARFLDKGAADN
jgi:hypothetical protein